MSLKINGMKRECMEFVREMPEEIGKDLSYLVNGWCKVISKCKLKQQYVLHKNKHYGQIIQRIKLTRYRKIHCVECLVKGEKLFII